MVFAVNMGAPTDPGYLPKRLQEKGSGRKSRYYLHASDLRLPPPVLCMSDFERHAQRKNRVIQATYDEELVKIGIDCKTSNKLLTSDTRRFCNLLSSKQLLKNNHGKLCKAAKCEVPKLQTREDPRDHKLPDILHGEKFQNDVETENSKEAWAEDTNQHTDDSEHCNSSDDDKAIESSGFFVTSNVTPVENKKLRLVPQSAKPHRIKSAIKDASRRPKSTTNVARHVTFWDMVAEPERKGNSEAEVRREKSVRSEPRQSPFRGKELFPTPKPSTSVLAGALPKPRKLCVVSKALDLSNMKNKLRVQPSKRVITPLSSFLHFVRLQASCELKRELRTNAGNRKDAHGPKSLSDILSTEKSTYEDSLSKMSNRLKDEKLLAFCKESRRDLDSVFEYNL